MPTISPDRSLSHLFPEFGNKIALILIELCEWCDVHLPGYQAWVAETFRSTERQVQLYAQGRTALGQVVTQKNGTTNKSNHQTALACDIAFHNHKGPTWDVPQAAWDYLQHLAHKYGLTSGSDWETFKDRPHVEWPTADTATYAKAKNWMIGEGLK